MASLRQKPLNHLSFLPLKMDAFQSLSNLCCELKIIRAKNIELKSAGDLFVRCYLSAGNNRKVQLNSKKISPKSDLFWDDSFSLECLGTQEAIDSLRQGNVVFELRCRNRVPVLGKLGGSKLLGRAEIPWKNVFESPNMEIETWVPMISKNRRLDEGVKPPAVQVSMKIRVPAEKTTRAKNYERLRRWDDECGCKDSSGCHSCADFDIFAIGFALEAF